MFNNLPPKHEEPTRVYTRRTSIVPPLSAAPVFT